MKEFYYVQLLVFYVITCVFIRDSFCKSTLDICKRTPIHTTASKTSGDNGFEIKILDLPEPGKYIPEETYTVEIKHRGEKLEWMLGFMLVAVPQGVTDEKLTSGNFIIPSDGRVQKAPDCDHTVITHHYLMFKKGMTVTWKAPPRAASDKSKCTEFRAAVIQQPDIWYKDEGKLTQVLCEQEIIPAPQGDATAVEEEQGCCACGTARYKMHFQGKWTRQRHSKDFPTAPEDTVQLHWSSIIGASHSTDYSIWEYGQYASRGVKEVCEYGFSNFLEQDMKRNSKKILTILKTKPLWGERQIRSFRNALLDVDTEKSLVSLLTMIGPSPDWCVGVSKLNLCLTNCSWADRLEIDLFPWDAGTDSGLSYYSRNIETDPPEKVHKITNTYPNHASSPFYSPNPIRPLATLTLTKTEESCEKKGSGSSQESGALSTEELIARMRQKMMLKKKQEMEKCATSDWTEWTDCSTTCGSGTKGRRRFLRNPQISPAICGKDLTESSACFVDCTTTARKDKGRKELPDDFVVRHDVERDPTDYCAVSPWSSWSPCTETCGMGIMERQRVYLHNSLYPHSCQKVVQEQKVCVLISCEKALMMKNFTAICTLPADKGPCRRKSPILMWHYNSVLKKCRVFPWGGCRGNGNRFYTEAECQRHCGAHMASLEARKNEVEMSGNDIQISMKRKTTDGNGNLVSNSATSDPILDQPEESQKVKKKKQRKKKRKNRRKNRKHRRRQRKPIDPNLPMVNCEVSDWSNWSPCSVTCGRGFITKTRTVITRPENGGKRCPRKMSRKRKCKAAKCPIDCEVEEWASWSACSKTCGEDAVQKRRRKVRRRPKHGGMDCPPRKEKRFCKLGPCQDTAAIEKMMRDAIYSNPSMFPSK